MPNTTALEGLRCDAATPVTGAGLPVSGRPSPTSTTKGLRCDATTPATGADTLPVPGRSLVKSLQQSMSAATLIPPSEPRTWDPHTGALIPCSARSGLALDYSSALTERSDGNKNVATQRNGMPYYMHIEWVLSYTNNDRSVQFLWPVEDLNLHQAQAYDAPQYRANEYQPSLSSRLSPYDFTRLPQPFNINAPYRPYIRRDSQDPVDFTPDLIEVNKAVSGGLYQLVDSYRASLITFVNTNVTLYHQWHAVLRHYGMEQTTGQFSPPAADVPWTSELNASHARPQLFGRVVWDALRLAYEARGCARLFMHRCIEHICSTLGREPPIFGVDTNLLGVVFYHPCQAPWIADFERRGIPMFGISVRQGRVETKLHRMTPSSENEASVAQEIQSSLKGAATKHRHIVLVRRYTQRVQHPNLWVMAPPSGYPGAQHTDMPLEGVLLKALYPNGPADPHISMLAAIRSVLGPGPFPRGADEPEPSPTTLPDFDPFEAYNNYDDFSGEEHNSDTERDPEEQMQHETDEMYRKRLEKLKRDAPKIKLQKEKAIIDERRAEKLMQLARRGDIDARNEISQRISGAKGKKLKHRGTAGFSALDAYLVENWRDPERVKTNKAKRRKRYQALEDTIKRREGVDDASRYDPPVSSDTPTPLALVAAPPSPTSPESSYVTPARRALLSGSVPHHSRQWSDQDRERFRHDGSFPHSYSSPSSSSSSYARPSRTTRDGPLRPTPTSPSYLPHDHEYRPILDRGMAASASTPVPTLHPSPYDRGHHSNDNGRGTSSCSISISRNNNNADPPHTFGNRDVERLINTLCASSNLLSSLPPPLPHLPALSLPSSSTAFIPSVPTAADHWVPIPLGQWYALEMGPVDGKDPHALYHTKAMDKFSGKGVFGVRRQRAHRGSPATLTMLFKSEQLRDAVQVELQREREARVLEHVTAFNTIGSKHFESRLDLMYIDQVFFHSRSEAEARDLVSLAPIAPTPENHLHAFLDYQRYPPCVPDSAHQFPPSSLDARRRYLHVVTFTAEWLSGRINADKEALNNRELRRLEMLMLTQCLHDGRMAKFVVSMWPTDGPLDAIVRMIARWASHDFGSDMTEKARTHESFGYTGRSLLFRMEIDLALDEPQYLLDPREDYRTTKNMK